MCLGVKVGIETCLILPEVYFFVLERNIHIWDLDWSLYLEK
jgi:hypothetical protein